MKNLHKAIIIAVSKTNNGDLAKNIELMGEFYDKEIEALNLKYADHIKFLEEQIAIKEETIKNLKQQIFDIDEKYKNQLDELQKYYNKEIELLKGNNKNKDEINVEIEMKDDLNKEKELGNYYSKSEISDISYDFL